VLECVEPGGLGDRFGAGYCLLNTPPTQTAATHVQDAAAERHGGGSRGGGSI